MFANEYIKIHEPIEIDYSKHNGFNGMMKFKYFNNGEL